MPGLSRISALQLHRVRSGHQTAPNWRLDAVALRRGVLLGIELVLDRESRAPANEHARAVLEFCQDAGLILQLRGMGADRNVLRLVPPMTTPDADIDRGLNILEDALRTASRERFTSSRGP